MTRDTLFRTAGWLRRRAENIAALLLAMVFGSFILQILFRYVLAWPVGWTLEVSTLAWMWLVLWGAAFVVRDRDEIRFDILYSTVADRLRRGFVIVAGLALVAVFAASFPAAVDYVTFMKIESASYIDIRFDILFSIYIVFAVAVMIRYLHRAWTAAKGGPIGTTDPAELRPAELRDE